MLHFVSQASGVFIGVGLLSGAAQAETVVPNTLDTDSYVFFGTDNEFSPEISVGNEGNLPHFNFGVVEFNDVSALDLTGEKYLRFEVEAYASTVIVDGGPVTTFNPTGNSTLKVVALGESYSSYQSTSDRTAWYSTYVGGVSADASGSFTQSGVFTVDVTDAVNDWISGAETNYGFALVVSSGDALELGASQGGNGPDLTSVPEPGSLGLIGVGAIAMLRRRRA